MFEEMWRSHAVT